MSEFVEIFKLFLESKSPFVISVSLSILVIYKSKDLLDIFFQIKDMKKKRIIEKFEETKNCNEKNYLDSFLNQNYERLCEEAQLHAIIGCQYCSKEMAQYILTRKSISGAIRIYHRVKDEVKVKDGSAIPTKYRSDRKIKFYKFVGLGLYWLLGCIGTFALAMLLITNYLMGYLYLLFY